MRWVDGLLTVYEYYEDAKPQQSDCRLPHQLGQVEDHNPHAPHPQRRGQQHLRGPWRRTQLATQDNTLQIKRPGNFSLMKFNNILPPASTQKDVFYRLDDSIKQFMAGINITIFAYGQTGAGKTYSIIGNYSPKDSQENLFNFHSSKERGILSRSL